MSAAAAARAYIERGFLVVPIPYRDKRPVLERWQELRLTKEELPQFFNGGPQNVGILLGHLGLADIDCDCPEARTAAALLLPQTGMVFGRSSNPQSHYLYRSEPPVRARQFRDPGDKKALVELRGLKADGSIGLQTVVPPSVHKETGEPIQFELGNNGDPAKVAAEGLVTAVERVAAAALLARHWPERGARHHAMLALAGILCRAEWPLEEAKQFCKALYQTVPTHDPQAIGRSEREVGDTYGKHASGGETTGIPTLTELVGGKTVQRALEWLRIDQDLAGPRRESTPWPAVAPPFQASHEGGAPVADHAQAARISQASRLINLAAQAELFQTPDRCAWAVIPANGHDETSPVRSRAFRLWLSGKFYRQTGQPPRQESFSEAVRVVEAKAIYDSPQRQIYTRVAPFNTGIVIDLSNNLWEVIHITAEGWKVLSRSPVPFRRTKGMLPLPYPEPGGDVAELRHFVNIGDDGNWVLCASFVVAAMRFAGPFPILVLQGEQGSAKSTTARVIRSLIDPSTAPIRSAPREDRDLMIAANNSWVLAFDNLSALPPWLSDAFCRLATGGGFSTRELYSDDQETVIDAMRPVILNGIDHVADRADLADRCIVVDLPTIPEASRKTEAELWAEFESARPRIFGAFLTAAATALKDLPLTRLSRLPRMADFACWATAASPAFGWEPNAFMNAYAGNRQESVEMALEADPVAGAVKALVLAEPEWQGTATELWKRLGTLVGETAMKVPAWPKSAHSLSGRVKRLAPALRATGIEVSRKRSGHGGTRTIRITGNGTENTVSSVSTVSIDGETAESLGLGSVGNADRSSVADAASPPAEECASESSAGNR